MIKKDALELRYGRYIQCEDKIVRQILLVIRILQPGHWRRAYLDLALIWGWFDRTRLDWFELYLSFLLNKPYIPLFSLILLYSMKIKSKLGSQCRLLKHCFEVVDKTDEVSHIYNQAKLTWVWVIFESDPLFFLPVGVSKKVSIRMKYHSPLLAASTSESNRVGNQH